VEAKRIEANLGTGSLGTPGSAESTGMETMHARNKKNFIVPV
jgi:hypothetical protein